MPYRRLPNTDSARLRAMEKALRKAEGRPPYELPYSVSTHLTLKNFYPEFKQTMQVHKDSLDRQTDKSKVQSESLRKARLYLSHFIQVLNFSIIRGELKPETRALFGLDEDECKLPQLNTEKDVIEWGQKIIKGEQERLLKGNAPITNPTIARVKVHYEDFLRLNQTQKHLLESNQKSLSKMAELRKKADELIVKLWNEVEDAYSELSAEDKRVNCVDYGVVYVYRRNEKLSFSNLRLENVS